MSRDIRSPLPPVFVFCQYLILSQILQKHAVFRFSSWFWSLTIMQMGCWDFVTAFGLCYFASAWGFQILNLHLVLHFVGAYGIKSSGTFLHAVCQFRISSEFFPMTELSSFCMQFYQALQFYQGLRWTRFNNVLYLAFVHRTRDSVGPVFRCFRSCS